MDKFNESKEIGSVLGILSLAEKGLTASEIGAAASISQSHLRHLIKTLLKEGIIHRLEVDLSTPIRYELTPELELGEQESRILKPYFAEVEAWLKERRLGTGTELNSPDFHVDPSDAVLIIDDEAEPDEPELRDLNFET